VKRTDLRDRSLEHKNQLCSKRSPRQKIPKHPLRQAQGLLESRLFPYERGVAGLAWPGWPGWVGLASASLVHPADPRDWAGSAGQPRLKLLFHCDGATFTSPCPSSPRCDAILVPSAPGLSRVSKLLHLSVSSANTTRHTSFSKAEQLRFPSPSYSWRGYKVPQDFLKLRHCFIWAAIDFAFQLHSLERWFYVH